MGSTQFMKTNIDSFSPYFPTPLKFSKLLPILLN